VEWAIDERFVVIDFDETREITLGLPANCR